MVKQEKHWQLLLKNIAKKYEPQINKIVNALTEEIISKEVKDGEQKNEK